MIAEVALNVPLRSTFDYLLPAAQETAVSPGLRVIVPFGRRQLTGIVVGLKERSALPPERLKVIRRIPRQETVFSDELFRFTRWLAEYYVCG
ncbi:MAG: primosomal protein N', partial [SAR324 cluster bacterium]|nr:primosomal protein N' [SAR324 cluster bacterium]